MESFLGPGLVPLDMAILSTCMQQFLLLIGLHRKLDQVSDPPALFVLSLYLCLQLSLYLYVDPRIDRYSVDRLS